MFIGIITVLCLALYPTVSDYVNSRSQSRVVTRYFDDVAVMDDGNMRAALEAAREYNCNLLLKTNRFDYTEEETQEYKKQLNTGRGVMGILVIDKIDIELPIYHGTEPGVLQVGVGHMQGTSLPVGGMGTHAFITGHRGLTSSKLLTDLNKMTRDDTFVLHVMGETLTYLVDDIQTVEPFDVDMLWIDPEMDCCTLVTCTPYGVNSHRLLVRGHRVDNAAIPEWEVLCADARLLDRVIVVLIFMIPVIPVLIIYTLVNCGKIRKGSTRR
jgi:sortase A